MVRPTAPETPSWRRPRDPRLQDILQNGTMWETFLHLGGMGYAGDDPDPRPLPTITLADLKRNADAALQTALRDGLWHIQEALHFAFYADRFAGESDRAITVPRDDLWWLASAGDTILLSDKVTHHYTTIANVDRDTGRVSFFDAWPERFFLKEGLNAAGVAATSTPLGITREEFHRVAVGVITMDTPALLDDYFSRHPDRTANVGLNLSCGLSLLDVQRERFARLAARYLRRALRLAEDQGAADTAALAARKLFVALTVAAYRGDLSGEPLAARPFLDELGQLTARFSRDVLLDGLAADDLCRMGTAAGNARDVDAALGFFDRAVAIDTVHEQARSLRAIAHVQKGSPAAAAEDAAHAVRLNIDRARAVEAERDTLDARDRIGRGAADARLVALRRRRAEAYALGLRAHVALEQWDEARAVGEALIALTPDDSDGYRCLAELEHRLGRLPEARGLVRQALEREKNPEAREALEKALAECGG